MRELTPDFSGLWIPLVTPFDRGAVDHPALYQLVRHLANQGVAGFVVCGSTGEAAALSLGNSWRSWTPSGPRQVTCLW